MFDDAGNYSVQLTNPDRSNAGPADYTASWGTYVVCETEQFFLLSLEGSLFPESVGTTAKRRVTWRGDTAVFTSDTQVVEGIESNYEITWQSLRG
ncbi:MAG: Lipocalin-like domain [Frankiales bacterium]|nr:Lipocalin-like domain [Frankiales bacterium]